MKKKLEVEIKRDGCEVTAKCLHLDEEYRGKNILIGNANYRRWFISSRYQTAINEHGLFVWGTNIDEDSAIDNWMFNTEEEAIKWIENITKLIDEFNAEEVKSTPRVVIPEEMLNQDEIDEKLVNLGNCEDVQDMIEIVAGVDKTYDIGNEFVIECKCWKYNSTFKISNYDFIIYLTNKYFDGSLHKNIYSAKDIEEFNNSLKVLGINAKIVESREITSIKSIDGIEFEVYLDELNKTVDNIK